MTVNRMLCIGECMAELVPLDGVADYRLGYAGDTFNTAWYLRQLRKEASISYLSAVGEDAISDQMLEFMQRAGIDTAHVARSRGRSVGLYLITLNNGERSFSYWRDTSAARTLADDGAALTSAMNDADLIYFSGITLAILPDAGRDRLIAALKDARAKGKTIAFDPNLRPRLWPDVTQMTTAIMQGAAACDIVLPTFEDEAAHFTDADPQATAARYQAAGATCVIVKNGPDPVFYVDGDATGEVPVKPADKVIDTTSAGDSFNAGFFATRDAGLPMQDRIALACATAAQVIGGKGALVKLDRSALPFELP